MSLTEGLTVIKEVSGQHRWVAISSSAYKDRDGEIVSTKALEDDVARADATGDYGPLLWWHVKGVRLGQCDYNAMHGRFLIESGTFDSEHIARSVKAKADSHALSIGFKHSHEDPDRDGVFHAVRRFERSILPRNRESNLFTALGAVMKEADMTKEKQEALEQLVGAEVASDLITQADETQKAADAAGTVFKETKPEDEKPKDEEADETEADDESSEGEDKPVNEKKETKPKRVKAATVGNLTVDEFAKVIGVGFKSAFEQAFAPVLAATKEAKPTDPALVKVLEGMDKRLKELESDVPKAAQSVTANDSAGAFAAAFKSITEPQEAQKAAGNNPLYDLFFPNSK